MRSHMPGWVVLIPIVLWLAGIAVTVWLVRWVVLTIANAIAS